MGAISDALLHAEIEQVYGALKDQPAHTPAQIALVKQVIALYLVTFKHYDFDRTRALVHEDYIQHSTMVGSTGQKSIIEVGGMMREMAAPTWTGPGEPHVETYPKRILVDGEFIAAQLHVVRWPGDPGQYVMDWFRFRDGKFIEHWDVVKEMPKVSEHGNQPF